MAQHYSSSIANTSTFGVLVSSNLPSRPGLRLAHNKPHVAHSTLITSATSRLDDGNRLNATSAMQAVLLTPPHAGKRVQSLFVNRSAHWTFKTRVIASIEEFRAALTVRV
jgi:hypothetical protein